ncbi:MAG: response regulator [Treponema sp.]|nr:response regulator [Treponema sp.]
MNEKRKTILAIDDDITILNTIRTVLEGSYEVSLAKNTDIARTILNTTKIDLILLDMNMPGTDGMEFLEFVHNDDSQYHIPVIIVSAQGTADVIVEIKKRGAVDFVVKPISPNILKEKIRTSLKAASMKIGRIALVIRLKKLIEACEAGKGGQVEDIVKELEQVYYEHEIDAKVAEICTFARDMEYSLAEENIRKLLTDLKSD